MKYKTLTKVNENPIGAVIELTDAEAEPLLKSQAIEPFIKPFSKPMKPTQLHSKAGGD